MYKRIFFLNLFAIVFYFSTDRLFSFSERETLKYLVIIFCVMSFVLAPSFTAKSKENEKFQVLDEEIPEGEYHNDFSRVGSSHDPKPIKPIDLSGDAIAHAKETLDEDLKSIGIKKED